MEKLNIQRDENEFYRLEVNDNGDYIEFDLTDISLAERVMKASKDVVTVDEEYKKKDKELLEKYNNDESEALEERIKLELEMCQEMRKIFDSFMGKGACQKIFGEKNNYWQFLNLMEALEPHFEKMHISLKKAKNKLANKYKKVGSEVM